SDEGFGILGTEPCPGLIGGSGGIGVPLAGGELTEGLKDRRLLVLGEAVEVVAEHIAGLTASTGGQQQAGADKPEHGAVTGGLRVGGAFEQCDSLVGASQAAQALGAGNPEAGVAGVVGMGLLE